MWSVSVYVCVGGKSFCLCWTTPLASVSVGTTTMACLSTGITFLDFFVCWTNDNGFVSSTTVSFCHLSLLAPNFHHCTLMLPVATV